MAHTLKISNTSLQVEDLHVLVVGLGKTGLSAVKFFLQQGSKVSVSDAGPENSQPAAVTAMLRDNDIAYEAGGHTDRFFSAADLIFVSPGIPLDLKPLVTARQRNIPVTGELAIAAQLLKTPVAAVTGTNGKTTVTTLLADIYQAGGKNIFIGGNIGTPLIEYLCGPQEAELIVAELSSFQLDTGGGKAGLPFRVAILLNISPDHLERYPSFAAYADSKFSVFGAQGPEDFAVLNADDAEIMSRKNLWPNSRKFFFGENLSNFAGASIQGEKIHLKNSGNYSLPDGMHGEVYDLGSTELKNPPNLQNAAAAVLAARLTGCRQQDIVKALAAFVPLKHRMTHVADISGVSFINDSKATNVGAVYSALKAMHQPVILIAGGRDKGGDYSLLIEPVRQMVKHLLLIGEARDTMARALMAFTEVEMFDTLQEAVTRGAALAVPGDVVLLSPACASFDMFSSYAERGEVFTKSVLELRSSSGAIGREAALN